MSAKRITGIYRCDLKLLVEVREGETVDQAVSRIMAAAVKSGRLADYEWIGPEERELFAYDLPAEFPDAYHDFPRDDDGAPRIYRNFYKCDCGASWNDSWSCACDDECPECGADVGPEDFVIETR